MPPGTISAGQPAVWQVVQSGSDNDSNPGLVGLAGAASLLDQVNNAIDALPAMARAARVTYLPPREPNIRPTITGADLRKD